jgi:hypothetical protein
MNDDSIQKSEHSFKRCASELSFPANKHEDGAPMGILCSPLVQLKELIVGM